jgi:hypothetical protein
MAKPEARALKKVAGLLSNSGPMFPVFLAGWQGSDLYKWLNFFQIRIRKQQKSLSNRDFYSYFAQFADYSCGTLIHDGDHVRRITSDRHRKP